MDVFVYRGIKKTGIELYAPFKKYKEKKDTSTNESGSNNSQEALKQAEKDIRKDPDLSPEPDPADDLDEGELAQLEGEE